MKISKYGWTLFISVLLVGCATVFTSIVTVTSVVDGAMKNWAQLSTQGLTTPEFDTKVMAAHEGYRKGAAIAQASLVLYQSTQDKDHLVSALRGARDSAQPLIDLIASILQPTKAMKLQTDLMKASKP